MSYLKEELYELIRNDPKIFDFIQESALDGMWYWDIENMEEEWMNPKFWTTLGYDPKEMPHKASAWQDIINPDDLKLATENSILHFEDPNHKYDQIVRYKHKDGSTVWIQCRGLAIRDKNGKPVRMLGAHTDVTKLKEREKELTKVIEIINEQNDRLKNFTYIVSHNLRSHSSNFEMLLNVFFSIHPDMEDDEILTHLRTTSTDLKETIDHLNEIVSMSSRIQENLKPVDLNKAIENCIANMTFYAENSKTKIINNVDKGVSITAIQSYIDSILLNFISNGIKYRSEDRDNTVTISNKFSSKYLILIIEDNGLGIDLKRHGDKLFGMYKTFHSNEDAKGIGLFIAKNQIEALGGKVTVESEVNKGTTFKIHLRYEKD